MGANPEDTASNGAVADPQPSTVHTQQDERLQQGSSNSSSATQQTTLPEQLLHGDSSSSSTVTSTKVEAQQEQEQQQQQEQQQEQQHLQPQQQQQQHLQQSQHTSSSSSGYYNDCIEDKVADVRPDDIITLNVGGRLFSCQRRTLCLAEESLLALMFGGRWPGGLITDAQGHVFLDLDPQLFEVVLNWLRQYNIYRGGNLHEPQVAPEQLVHMVAMLDYLQLHRQIPLTYHETFDAEHCSPFMLVQDATATRTAVAAQHPGKHVQRSGKTLMQFAVSDRPYFDMVVDITLKVHNFHDSIEKPSPARYMFIGFVHQAAAEQLDPTGPINTQLTKSPSCYGWLVGNGLSHTVRHGKRSQEACFDGRMWNQGDQIKLTLDTRRDLPYATITCLNTVTGLSKSINADPTFSSAGNTTSGAAGSSNNSSAGGSQPVKKSRPGLRHRLLSMPPPPQIPDREEVLAILRRQQIAPGANLRVAELVVGAVLQILEAQGLAVHESLDILRRPGLLQRLVQQVTDWGVQGGLVPEVGQQAAAAPAAAGGVNNPAAADVGDDRNAAAAAQAAINADGSGVLGEEQSQGGGESQKQEHATSTAATQQQRHKLPDGMLLPASTAEYEWVLVVGLVHPTDSVRIVSVRRRGMRPGQA